MVRGEGGVRNEVGIKRGGGNSSQGEADFMRHESTIAPSEIAVELSCIAAGNIT